MKNTFTPMASIKLAATIIFALANTSLFAQNLITGGGFEEPALPAASFLVLPEDDDRLSPWVIGGLTVDVVSEGGGTVIGAPFEGNQFLDLSGTPGPGIITQTFTTVPGEPYILRFAYANNYAVSPEGAEANLQVFDLQGDLLTASLRHNTSSDGNLNWTPFSSLFTARTATTTITFESTTPGNGGILLDGISVEAFVVVGGAAIEVEIQRAVAITWESVPGQLYQPQINDSLSPNSWISFGEIVLGNGITQTVFDRADIVPRRFYRVLDIGMISEVAEE